MANPMSNRMKKRLNKSLVFLLSLGLIWVLSNLVLNSVVKSDFYKDFAASQQMSSQVISANRGTIYDTNMKVLAQSAVVWTVVISPATIAEEKKELVARSLAEILQLDYETVLEKVNQTNRYQKIKEEVEKPEADLVRAFIKENKIYAITLTEDTKRYYPNNELAAHVIGFTGTDNTGLYGVELYYDEILQGTAGKILSAIDGKGNTIPTSYEERYEPIDGQNIVLTIDETIQHFTQKALDAVVQEHQPKKGALAIVMDVNTGAILAMANSPTYDLNSPFTLFDENLQNRYNNNLIYNDNGDLVQAELTDEEKSSLRGELQLLQWNNQAISKAYEPGSVFKIITACAALEVGTSTWQDRFYCGGSITVAGIRMGCHKASGHGDLDFTDAIVYSCNPAFIEIGTSLGALNFYNYFNMFGFTEKTGIDLPGEGNSIYLKEEQFGPVELASVSFGQTSAVTAIQMITGIATAVNGGYLVTPHVLKEVQDSEGNITQKTQTEVKRQVISEEISKQMALAMEEMVAVNGGSTAYVKGYRIGGKSGTSQKKNADDDKISSFVSFAPVEDPQIAVLVVLDEPSQGEYYGSVVAGPALASIMSDTLPYLGVATEFSDEEYSQMETSVPDLITKTVADASAEITGLGLEVVVVGEGTEVVDQMPRVGQSVADGSKVVLYTQAGITQEQVQVPNIVGLTPQEAKERLSQLTLNISMYTGEKNVDDVIITEQHITEGTTVTVGSVISVKYSRTISEGLG